MPIFTFMASWVILGWVVFFAALPFGVKQQQHPQPGTDPGAPERPQLLKKTIIAAVISGVIMLALAGMIKLGWLDFYQYFSGGRGNSGLNNGQ
ncbi:MAG: DUF1467 family protein [Candidatus Symbiobacter sp.]|nr:DUF1467 family protein [Candidatus Symbiobacter sp.]